LSNNLISLIKSAGIRNFAKLLSANVLAQVIGLVVYPILTRIYAPEDFGLLNLFVSISSVIVIFTTAEYHNAIVLPKEQKHSVAMVHWCLIQLLLVVFLTLVSVLFSKRIALIFNVPALSNYYWLMPLMVLATSGWNILNYWYIYRTNYTRISSYQLSQSVLSAGSKLGFGYGGILQGGLIYSVVLSPILSLITSLLRAGKKDLLPLCRFDSLDIREVVKEYRNFPKFSLPRSLVNMVAGQLPILLLTPIFGVRYVGWWSMAIMLGFTPISVIAKSIYQVMYQHTTRRVNASQPLGTYFRRFAWMTLSAILPLFAILAFVLPDLTAWLLGDEWRETGTYIQWMLPWLVCSLLTSSIGFLADVFYKQKLGLGFELLTALLRTIGVCVGIWMHDFSISVAGYAVGSAMAVLAQYIWLMGLVKNYDRGVGVR
jgi:O-antigen/teichoic acid export membrane protein